MMMIMTMMIDCETKAQTSKFNEPYAFQHTHTHAVVLNCVVVVNSLVIITVVDPPPPPPRLAYKHLKLLSLALKCSTLLFFIPFFFLLKTNLFSVTS